MKREHVMRVQALIALGVLLASCAGSDGADGSAGKDGASCSVKDNGDGTNTILCTDGTSITVQNGRDGKDGKPGTNGTDGTSCTVRSNADGTRTIACTDGTSGTVGNGADGTSCTVADNGDGTKTIRCSDGTSVTVLDGTPGKDGGSCTVANGADGSHTITCADGSKVVVHDGTDGLDVRVAALHGEDHLLSTGEYADGAKYFVNATIDGASAEAGGTLTVDFTVKDLQGKPVTAITGFSANVAKLLPAAAGHNASTWVPYIQAKQTVKGSATGNWPKPDGTSAWQGSRESNGTLTAKGDGTYTYVFKTNLSDVAYDGNRITYDRNRLHRVSIMLGGHAGPTDDAVFDFVPDGSTPTESRDIVRTAVCLNCHNDKEFHGHGGDRLTVENCVTCHAPGGVDPQGGESLDLKVMIHKIHAGKDLASIPGADGKVFDDPATPVDESADNGHYAIWGFKDTMVTWWKAGFPSEIATCTKCHEGAGAQVANWKEKPSREACGSCHDTIDWAAGTNHPGGKQDNDNACTVCHAADGAGGLAKSVAVAHDGFETDPRNVPEFDIALALSPPANGKYFVAGESPVVNVVLNRGGTAIDHTTVVEDGNGAEGCLSTGCPPADGKFTGASLFVSGPRSERKPVLTTAARAAIASPTAGPFDVSAASGSLILKVDQGVNVIGKDVSLGDVVLNGAITVPVTAGSFASPSAATATELAAWLNASPAFKARAIAYEQAGKLAIRSRGLGNEPAIQLQASSVATSVFGGDLTLHISSAFTSANNIAQRTNPANNDPKAVRTTDRIAYTLDPVDDLVPGTYVASVEIADRGRKSDTDYQTPSVAKVTFQVKQEKEQPLIADGCNGCHQDKDGRGLIIDPPRHNKILSNTAVDQCGACHDYLPQTTTGTVFAGAKPISRRVHAVHDGAHLMTPNLTVDHADTVPGRNWDIEYPQDVRNCESCHGADTSGTWKTNPNRLACSGCHDTDAANAHMSLMTWDPTPADAFSGDEQESCSACH
jgi:OmcA/MtrC family decaheme c-type cytochrome